MTISTDKGTKGPEDIIIKYNELPITFKEIGQILLMLWENEDKLYPPSDGFQGAKMSLNFINELFDTRTMTDDLLKRYFLK